MKKAVLIIACVLFLTGCEKVDNLGEVYDVAKEANELVETNIGGSVNICQIYYDNYQVTTADGQYEQCLKGLESIAERIKSLDGLMKVNSDNDLVQKWKEKKKTYKTVIEDMQNYYKVLYSLDMENHENTSKLSKSALEEISKSTDVYKKVAKKLGISWYNEFYKIYATAYQELDIAAFLEAVETACTEDENQVCSFEE